MVFKEMLVDCFSSAIKVSLVVGTTLSIINQTPDILALHFTTETSIRIGMNFLVPFLVASYSRYNVLKEIEALKPQEVTYEQQ